MLEISDSYTRKKLMTLQPRTQNALYIFAVNQNIVMYTHLWLINKFYCENTCVYHLAPTPAVSLASPFM